MKTYYNLNDIVKNMILDGKSLNEICFELNYDKKFIISVLKNIKNDILLSYKTNEFYILNLIDNILYKKDINHTLHNNDISYKEKVIELINKGYAAFYILNFLSINERNLLYIVKKIYYESILNKNIVIDINLLQKIIDEIINYLKEKNNNKNIVKIESSDENMILEYNDRIIKTDSKCGQIFDMDIDNQFKFIVISDTHFGSVFENIDYLKMVYDYANKNDIKYIFHAGDLIEGSYDLFGRCKKEYCEIGSQVNHVIEDYCYDSNITNMILLANHDVYSIYNYGIDISELLKVRNDFKMIGYRSAYIKINDKYISLKHEISRLKNNINDYMTLIDFIGHSHQYRCNYNKSNTRIKVPTLSDLKNNYIVNKGFLVGNINSDNGVIIDFSVKYIDFDYLDREIILERKLKK